MCEIWDTAFCGEYSVYWLSTDWLNDWLNCVRCVCPRLSPVNVWSARPGYPQYQKLVTPIVYESWSNFLTAPEWSGSSSRQTYYGYKLSYLVNVRRFSTTLNYEWGKMPPGRHRYLDIETQCPLKQSSRDQKLVILFTILICLSIK